MPADGLSCRFLHCDCRILPFLATLSDSVLDQTSAKYWVKADTTMKSRWFNFRSRSPEYVPERLPLHSRKPM
jgi:hypothetical protein